MKIVAFAVAFVFMMEYSFADNSETFRIEKITEGSTYVLRMTDSTGKLVEIVDVHEEEDFMLIKPETDDDNVCLVAPALTKESKISECYKRVPVPQDEYRVDKFAECENREIFFLQPQYPEYCSNKGALREKRETCTTTENAVPICVRKEEICTKPGWWSCDRREMQCAEYEIVILKTTTCN